MNSIEIPDIPASKVATFRNHLHHSDQPIIIRGGAIKWAACQKWSLPYFREQFGDREYACEVGMPDGLEPVQFKLSDFQKTLKLRDFADLVARGDEGKNFYIANKSIDRFPGLESDVDFVALTGFERNDSLTKVWLGSKGTKSSLHTDPYTNVLTQIFGRKSVYLVAPGDSKNLYLYPSHLDKAQADPESPDTSKHPKS